MKGGGEVTELALLMVAVFVVGERTKKAAATSIRKGESTQRRVVFGIGGRHGRLHRIGLWGRASVREKGEAHFSTRRIVAL